MQWEVEPTGARIAQLATDLTARIDALDPESDTPVYSDFTFSIAVADWTLANGVYTARVNNTVLLTENAGIQVFYDASLRTGLTGDIFADKHTGYINFTTTLQPVGPISGIIRVLDSVSGMLSVAKGGTGAATPKKARENLNTPIRDIPVDFGTVSSLPQTIYDADITANMVAFDAVFGNPAAVPGGIDVTFAAGSVTISGTMVSGQETTIKFLCHEKRTAVEGTESGSAEPRVNEFVHVGAQTLTAEQQAQIRTNLGAASTSDLATLNSELETGIDLDFTLDSNQTSQFEIYAKKTKVFGNIYIFCLMLKPLVDISTGEILLGEVSVSPGINIGTVVTRNSDTKPVGGANLLANRKLYMNLTESVKQGNYIYISLVTTYR